MAYTYSPVKFTGEHAQEIFSEVLQANNTVSKNLVRVHDDIKNEEHITELSGEIDYQAYKEDIRETDIDGLAGDGPKLEDSTIKPIKMMAFDTFKMNQLRFTRFAKGMASGAANITSNEFEQLVLDWALPRLGLAFERRIWNGITTATKALIAAATFAVNSTRIKAWAAAQPTTEQDGLIAGLIISRITNAPAETIHIVGTAINVTNIGAEYAKVFAAIPFAVFAKGDFKIFAPLSHQQMILQANLNQTYRDMFTVAGGSFSYLTAPIEFIPVPENCLIAARAGAAGDLVVGTDLLSDVNSLEVNKVNNVGEELFMKQICSLDTTVVTASQKVLYI